MITTNNVDDFLKILKESLSDKKLIFGSIIGYRIKPSHEIRLMSTVGGLQYGISEIDCMNQKGSGIYVYDAEDAYLQALSIEDKYNIGQWFLVDNVEHTIDTRY